MNFGEGEDKETALNLVMQFLDDLGYSDTLKSLEAESGECYEASSLKMGGRLMSIIEEHKSLKAFDEDGDREERESMLVSGESDYAKEALQVFDTIHKSNILSIRFSPDAEKPWVATGSTDKTVKVTDYKSGEEKFSFTSHTGPILSLDFNPKNSSLLLSSAMDGAVCLYDLNKGQLLQKFANHTKYAVRVRWNPEGTIFVSASYDKTIRIYKKNEGNEQEPFVFDKSLTFLGNPEAVAFSLTEPQLIVAVREDNYLQLINLETYEKTKVNMNENLDNHVSFSALDLAVSPDGKYILVSTDHDRLIMLKMGTSQHMRRFYGASNDSYSQPRCCFSPSGKYVYSTSQDNKIYVWDVATQKIVTRLQGHSALVRDIDLQPQENILGSASFDKRVLLWQ